MNDSIFATLNVMITFISNNHVLIFYLSTATTTPKPKVFINKQQPIVINRPAQSYVVNAGAPVHIRPAPVVIQSQGKSEYRPYVQTITSKPIVVDKKIIKIERPIVKKYYEEKYSKTEPSDCGQTIPLPPTSLPSPCSNAAIPAPVPYVPVPVAPAPSSLPADISALLAGASAYPHHAPAPPCGCGGNVIPLAWIWKWKIKTLSLSIDTLVAMTFFSYTLFAISGIEKILFIH